MPSTPAPIVSFLASSSIAVVGISRDRQSVANAVFARLRENGHSAVPVNPHLKEYEGMPCYPDLKSIPSRPDAVFIVTPSFISASVVRQCSELGIRKVWFHRSVGDGSWSLKASEECKKAGIEAIEGGCPLMFVGKVDIGHRCMRWIFQKTGKVPV